MLFAMEVDRNGMEVLDREHSLALLRSATIGRLAIHAGALPAIVPVNFAVTEHAIVIRTGTGSKLQQAIDNAVVAFEVDDFDPMRHTGWSVNVVGVAREITEPGELELVRRVPLAHWVPGEATHYVGIALDVVSGRRLLEGATIAV
jgi:uncharacterized protein